ncbi:PEP-CTERM sorting domain-containing protein [Candidatus Gracilibacteria bacterium]|nr:PEP-CTERM sorting domain-containing protein [Candidatus Gracilibacteria bacterium]NJM90622.1 PEP-CTERM sorting domain-containing protein [Hydrococcus sp. RU_2_2]NJP21625.1 PEP-CTERM sorting domain-containing protein [Hydrococcus sp. CRU_1_1]
MRNFCLSLLLGLTTMITVSAPLMVRAASFDYSKIKNFSARPIDSDNTLIVSFGYTDIYFATDNGATPLPNDNFNVFLSDPTPALKVAGLDPLASGLADAFLQDMAAGGGFVQQVSEDPNIQFNFSVSNGYAALNLNLPLELRVVQNTSIPEPASILGLLTLGAFGIVSRLDREKQQK